MLLTLPTPITKLLGNAVQILGTAVPSSLSLEQDVLEPRNPVGRLVCGQSGLLVVILITSILLLTLHDRDHAVGALEQLLDVLWGHPVRLSLLVAAHRHRVVLCCLDCGRGDVSIIHTGANPAIKPGRDDGRVKSQGGQDPGVWNVPGIAGVWGREDICGYFVGLEALPPVRRCLDRSILRTNPEPMGISLVCEPGLSDFWVMAQNQTKRWYQTCLYQHLLCVNILCKMW